MSCPGGRRQGGARLAADGDAAARQLLDTVAALKPLIKAARELGVNLAALLFEALVHVALKHHGAHQTALYTLCLLYTSDAADE